MDTSALTTITINRGNTFFIDLVFTDTVTGEPVDIRGQSLLMTLTSQIECTDENAEIRKLWEIPVDGPEETKSIFSGLLTAAEMLIPVGTYYMNYRLVGSSTVVSDSEIIKVIVEQGPTVRTSQ